jgi:Ca2+-binding EF-hand superfamily protein
VSRLTVSFAALIALGVAGPAAAAQAGARPATTAQKPAAAQAAPTRASLMRNLDTGFKAIDTNGDGSLNAAELQAAEGKVQQQRLAQLRARFEADFTKLDTNKDGQLSKTEFMVAAPTTPRNAPNGAAILGQLDKNKDSKVSADEYRGPQLAMFDRIDTDKNGTLSPAERQAAQTAARK